MVVVCAVGWLVFQGPRLWSAVEEPVNADGKVVSLDAFRKQRERERRAQEEGSGLREVFASPVLHEADLTASLLPMGEMLVQVMVSQADWARAQRLLESQPSGMPPEDSSTA
jgi:hypothetical protein